VEKVRPRRGRGEESKELITVINNVNRQEQTRLIGIRVPGVYTRRFIEYLTDAQLTRLSFWLLSQKEGANSAHRLNQIELEVERRGLQLPATWQKLPFDDEVQRVAWGLWAATRSAKNPFAVGKPKRADEAEAVEASRKSVPVKRAAKKANGTKKATKKRASKKTRG